MNQELISVIVPIYNVEKYLSRCIESILKQTFSNLEIILVDDGSTDESKLIVCEYVKKDKRIVAVNKENGGLSDARNAGIAVASGNYLVFVDSDDYIHSQFIEILYHNIKKYDADIAVCEGIRVDDNHKGNVLQTIPKFYRVDVLDSISGMKLWYKSDFKNPTVVWNKIYKKGLFQNVKFDIGKLHEDEFIMHRLYIQSRIIVYVWLGLYYYYARMDSITGGKKYSLKRLDVLEAYAQRTMLFSNIGDLELIKLHNNHYIDVLLGCAVNLQVNYRGMDKSLIKKIIKRKIVEVRNKNSISSKQQFKILLYLLCPCLYSKIYNLLKSVIV